MRSIRTVWVAGAVLGLASLLGLAACGQSPKGGDKGSRATGVPTHYAAAIADGLKRYPSAGTVGRGDAKWACPLEDSIEVDGQKQSHVLYTVFAQPLEGVYIVQCEFYSPLPVTLSFTQAKDEAAYARLVKGTGAFKQSGNVQTETVVTVGLRELTVVRFEYPTNKSAGVVYEAHYLDKATLSRTSIVVADTEKRSKSYAEKDAAADLAALLSR